MPALSLDKHKERFPECDYACGPIFLDSPYAAAAWPSAWWCIPRPSATLLSSKFASFAMPSTTSQAYSSFLPENLSFPQGRP